MAKAVLGRMIRGCRDVFGLPPRLPVAAGGAGRRHSPRAVLAGAARSDYTGILSAIAGVVLIALAFRLGLRGRRLWVRLSVGIVSVFVIAQWLVAPAINAGLATNGPRPAIARAQSLGLPGARDVSFIARDGVRLAGW